VEVCFHSGGGMRKKRVIREDIYTAQDRLKSTDRRLRALILHHPS
jgi:hypothetical protein